MTMIVHGDDGTVDWGDSGTIKTNGEEGTSRFYDTMVSSGSVVVSGSGGSTPSWMSYFGSSSEPKSLRGRVVVGEGDVHKLYFQEVNTRTGGVACRILEEGFDREEVKREGWVPIKIVGDSDKDVQWVAIEVSDFVEELGLTGEDKEALLAEGGDKKIVDFVTDRGQQQLADRTRERYSSHYDSLIGELGKTAGEIEAQVVKVQAKIAKFQTKLEKLEAEAGGDPEEVEELEDQIENLEYLVIELERYAKSMASTTRADIDDIISEAAKKLFDGNQEVFLRVGGREALAKKKVKSDGTTSIKLTFKGKEIGRGSFGVVYTVCKLATKKLSEQHGYVIKQPVDFMRDTIASLKQEGMVAEYLNSKREDLEGLVFLFTTESGVVGRSELCRSSLEDDFSAIFGKGPEVMRQLAVGLEYIHNHGVLQGDIKPDNIFIDTEGKFRLADFGGAMIVEEQKIKWQGDVATLRGKIRSEGIREKMMQTFLATVFGSFSPTYLRGYIGKAESGYPLFSKVHSDAATIREIIADESLSEEEVMGRIVEVRQKQDVYALGASAIMPLLKGDALYPAYRDLAGFAGIADAKEAVKNVIRDIFVDLASNKDRNVTEEEVELLAKEGIDIEDLEKMAGVIMSLRDAHSSETIIGVMDSLMSGGTYHSALLQLRGNDIKEKGGFSDEQMAVLNKMVVADPDARPSAAEVKAHFEVS